MKRLKYITINLLSLVLFLIFSPGCDKEMLLTEFTDYEFDYQPEIRIEAILNTEFPGQTVVRIDYTIPVTDTTIFNGRDDDGDWIGYEDLNENGKWDEGEPLNDDLGEDGMSSEDNDFMESDDGEADGFPTPGEPHIDELDEIISQLHDSTFIVELHKKSTDTKVADFSWQARADSIEIIENYDTEVKEIVWYGGYKLTTLLEPIDYDEEYEFRIQKNSNEISAIFQPEPPVDYLTHLFTMDNDTLIVTETDTLAPIWSTGADPIVFWIKVERIWRPDSVEIINDHPAIPIDLENGIYLGGDFTSFYFPGLYRWTVYVPSHNYGQYVYSSLPITDSSISNWRDENSDVVLGCAGSMAMKSIYVRINKQVEKIH